MSLADQGSINEAALSTEALGRSYGTLQQQVSIHSLLIPILSDKSYART